MIATSDFLTALECTKFVFGRGSAPDPAGGAYSAPQVPSLFEGPYTSKGGGQGRARRKEKGAEGKRRAGTGPPYAYSWIRPRIMSLTWPKRCPTVSPKRSQHRRSSSLAPPTAPASIAFDREHSSHGAGPPSRRITLPGPTRHVRVKTAPTSGDSKTVSWSPPMSSRPASLIRWRASDVDIRHMPTKTPASTSSA